MPRIYVVRYKHNGITTTTVFPNHLPRPGTMWMLDEAHIAEYESTGKQWHYDRRSKKLVAQSAPAQAPKLIPDLRRKRKGSTS